MTRGGVAFYFISMRLKKRVSLVTQAVCFFISILALQACSTSGKKSLSQEERVRLLVDMGNSSLIDGDPTGALVSFLQAENLDSSLPELNHSLAITYYLKNDLKMALKYAQKAVSQKPSYSIAQNTLGKIHLELNQLDQAKEALTVAASDPVNREAYKAWTNLGVVEERRENWSAAEKMYTEAIRSEPLNSCIAYFYRGNLKLKKNQYTEAIQDYTLASQKFCAKFGGAFLALGQAYQQSKQYDLARKTYLEVVKRYPDTSMASQAMEQLRFMP